jgi:serine/threonine-protein kinase
MAFSAGQIVNGKYRVIRLLGDGGMGSVYEAHHEVLGTRVALKLLHAELSRTGVAKRFLQEARASARIKSPHVVGVSDADQTPEGLAFIVLEYIEGKTLRETYDALLQSHANWLAYSDALEFAMQMFEGVEAAHAAGIVHRDLKPDNVMITQDQRGGPLLKILDFGIAKVDELPESGQALTRPGALLGTPEYMAPEQVYSANSADVRSDVFSLGVILFEMLSGHRPVLSDDPQQIAVSYLTGAFTRLEDACPQLPPGLAAAVHKALAAQPRDRFATVAELRAAVEPFAPPRANPGATSRISLPALAPTDTVGNPRKPPLPGTLIYSQPPGTLPPSPAAPSGPASAGEANPPASTAPPTQDEEAAITRSANMPRIAPSVPPPANGTAVISALSGPQPAAFAPDYPSAMGPFSGVPPTQGHGQPGAPSQPPGPNPKAGPAGTAFVPEYPPPFAAQSQLPSDRPMASPAGTWAPQAAPVGGVAPPPRSNAALWAGIALAVLLVGSGITLGALYYLGWLDSDPPAKTHKPPPRPHPTAAPTHKPPSQLR